MDKSCGFRSTKKPILHTNSPHQNQNTPGRQAKKYRRGYIFREGCCSIQFILNEVPMHAIFSWDFGQRKVTQHGLFKFRRQGTFNKTRDLQVVRLRF